jgi:hypothetical protein
VKFAPPGDNQKRVECGQGDRSSKVPKRKFSSLGAMLVQSYPHPDFAVQSVLPNASDRSRRQVTSPATMVRLLMVSFGVYKKFFFAGAERERKPMTHQESL